MNQSQPVPSLHTTGWRRLLADPMVRIGAVIGFAPVFAGLIFRTHGYHVMPGWAEVLRQLDVPFILIEVAVILWARSADMNYRELFARLDRPAQFALTVFLASFWISSAFISADPGYSLLRASFWFVHIAFGFAVFHLVGTAARAGLKHSGAAIIAGFLVFVPLMAVHLLSAPDPATIPYGKVIWSSAIPGCLSVRHLGLWAALVLACAVGALYAPDVKSRETGVLCVAIFLATAVLFWSGTRAGVYGIIGGLAVLSATLRVQPSRRVLAMACLAAFPGMAISELWLPPDGAFGIFERLHAPAGEGLEGYSSGRTVLWASMLQAYAKSPIFGVGEGAVHWLASLGSAGHVQPHNSIVQMLSSWGLIACLAAGYLIARLLLLIHRSARRDAQLISLVLMIDCLLIMSLADGVLYFSRFIMWFAGGSAVALAMVARAATDTPCLKAALEGSAG